MVTLESPERLMQYDSAGKPISGVGPGAPLVFVKAYFPEVQQVIRIASAFFTLSGYQLGRKYALPEVQFRILVGKEEGKNVTATVLQEILDDLGRCETELWETVAELVERLKNGQFRIMDARAMQTPFHCKFYICDDTLIWQGSSNFSRTGLYVSSEQVSASRDPAQVQQFTVWYDDAARNAKDLVAELIARLEGWLKLATPFEIYLKTLLFLNNLPDEKVRSDGHQPAYYQKGVIARALRLARSFGGGLIVAATGLGKTVMGAEIAWRLQMSGQAKRLILVAPNGVRENWENELSSRDVNYKFFNIGVLFRKPSAKTHHQANKLDEQLRQADSQTTLLIDEAHFYRNQLLSEKSKGHKSLVYERLEPVVKRGANIFLLTATAYGTNMQNLNSLLYLLPHRQSNLVDSQNPFRASSADEFARLPVVTILGLPHVLKIARQRGDVDENGRTFIQFADEKRYLPRYLRLQSVRYQLTLQADLLNAFDQKCFSQANKFRQHWYDDDTSSMQLGLIDTLYNNALESWLSSPAALAESIALNLQTPGKQDYMISTETGTAHFTPQLDMFGSPAHASHKRQGHLGKPRTTDGIGYQSYMQLSQAERQAALMPLLDQLKQPDYQRDDKFQKLSAIIHRHCISQSGKVVVFVKRHLTAQYLLKGLEQTFGKKVQIGSTVETSEDSLRLKSGPYRSEVLKNFSPRSHNYDADREYNVLICTDADGVGVNLQDADTVINYDPPEGADTLFQRAGRVLRMTNDPERVVFFYTLVPSLSDEVNPKSQCQNDIRAVFQRIRRRHVQSKQILGSEVMSEQESVEVSLDADMDVEQLTRDQDFLADIGGLGAEAMMTHTAALEQYRTQAEALPEFLLSARRSSGVQHEVFVLLRHQQSYRPVIFDLLQKQLEELTDLAVLDRLRCELSEPRAVVNPEHIERAANVAMRAWCEKNNISTDQVRKTCALYLLPEHSPVTLEALLDELGILSED
ncbi:MAG: DEAD/DEAH box helicase family protein [Thermoflexales bacterium]|nr:DEAD/DEAH box helicase family protein [Thermoflexales bacterium]